MCKNRINKTHFYKMLSSPTMALWCYHSKQHYILRGRIRGAAVFPSSHNYGGLDPVWNCCYDPQSCVSLSSFLVSTCQSEKGFDITGIKKINSDWQGLGNLFIESILWTRLWDISGCSLQAGKVPGPYACLLYYYHLASCLGLGKHGAAAVYRPHDPDACVWCAPDSL